MSRKLIPLSVSDTSAFAKSLRALLSECDGMPSHLELLNMLAKAAGHGNFQSLRAKADGPDDSGPTSSAEEQSPPKSPVPDGKLVERVARCFDGQHRLLRWPARRSDQIAALWVLWAQMPPTTELSERDINNILKETHDFGDHALLRRELCDLGLMTRKPDGSIYRRIERPMPVDAAAALRYLSSR